jgi:AAA+ ATPase superfamily predicted ATPase
MFYGRKAELEKMGRLYDSGEHQTVVIYGRRRVGKTALISEFCRDKRTLFFSAMESTAEKNLETLSKTINAFLYPDEPIDSVYSSFDDALKIIYDSAKKERLVFVIDEYPYLAAAERSISSVIQHAIDHKFSKMDIFIILCGSSMSFMENQVLGHNSPLYGRRTAQLKIEPLNYLTAAEANPHLSHKSNAIIYGITGGVPHYINKLSVRTDEDLDEKVIRNIFDTSGYLFEEPANLLKQELREPATYNSIISAMASGASRLNEISSKASLEYALCSKYLSVLMSLGIVGKKEPVFGTVKNRSVYYIKDNLFSFWYRFIPGNMSNIMAGKAELVYEREVRPYIDHHMGIQFEKICVQYLIHYAKDLPFLIKEIGGWWRGNPETKKQEEIDILAVNGKYAIFSECKWRSDPVGPDVIKDLERRSMLFHDIEQKYLYLFSRSGFTSGAVKMAEENRMIHLITLADIYDI